MCIRDSHSDDLMKRVAAAGTLHEVEGVPDDIKHIFPTAHDVSPEWHVRMQAAFQDHTDNAVSKTVNFANSATPADVEEVYRLAYELGTKGVTIYRDGSRSEQVLNIGEVKRKITGAPDEADGHEGASTQPANGSAAQLRRNRGAVLVGETREKVTGCGSLYVTINLSLIHI